ncbi:non-ribosomal peptide synthetase [Microtetraspora niveoalba]|uniref:non-ribosomal peptide synthetase n=1 Tax=Microtetraspora niveoalba TaxID=46175 RepID=UPI0008361F31|nr:non-ribosomal peptide synthetase [Microtetraspora niveoalba]
MPRFEPRPTNPFPLLTDRADGERAARDFPLSAGQERLWWLRQLDSSHDQYHITGGWRFPAGLDPSAIATALAGLARRHDILRTRFVLRPDGTTAQEVAAEVEIPVVRAGREWRAAVERAASEPFDLSRPPLLRVVAAETEDGPGLFVALHHIVTDRWSMDVLARDLFELYDAATAGRAPRLPELAVQYGDYARWQQRLLDSDLLRPGLEHWRRTLAGCERLELPTDRPRTAAADGAGASVVVELPEEATAAMTAVAWRARASPGVVVTAALVAALSAFTGQDDVVIGAIVSDRPRPELQDLIGFFVNTVVLRVDASGRELTFRDVVARTRDVWMAADAHQDVPFERIVGAVGAGAEQQRNPIFDVVVNHAGDRTALAEAPGAPTWWYPELPVTARFDLSLTTQLVDGRLRATFVYRPALFDETTIAALADRYIRLLAHGAAAPDRPLHELGPAGESGMPLGGEDPAPRATVVELVEARAALHPDDVAVTGAGGELSYGELNRRANRLARHLMERGVGRGRVVGVCLDQTVERFVVLLAIVKCGAAYFPLDPDFPPDRLRFMLSDAGAVLTIVSPSLAHRLPADATPLLVLGEPDLTGYDAGNPPLAARPGDLAYLISTSGSTGAPKSVAVPHQALSRLVAGAPRYLDIGPGATFLQAGPLTFDVSVLEWTPLAHGGRVVVTGTGALLEDLEAVVRDHGVTTLKLVSPQLDLLVERGLSALSGLRQLVVGGDVVNPRSFRTARELLPGCRVTASYGPTECTVLATVFDGDSWSGRVPIGHAIPHTRAYVLDRDLNPAPVGMRGEIHLAGDGLARGYHGRPGLTAQAFVPDPYGPPGSRMYRTGDVGRLLPGGAIDFLGRADRQVKVRGYRIETSEIEHALLRHGATSAVVLRAELDTGPALVAYVVADESVDVPALRGRLRATLPAYMIPDHLVRIPRVPLTANNKVDRTALPPVTPARSAAAAPAESGLEARVAEAWSEVLGRVLAAGEDFFDHGGHSLLVPRATAAVRRLLGREVPLRLMMRHRTPAAYAAALLAGSLPGLGADSRLERLTWHSRTLGGERRVDLFVPAGASGGTRLLVVLDGSEFVDVMRLPAIVDRLVRDRGVPPTAAVFISPADWSSRRRELLDEAYADVLAHELIPQARTWLGERCRSGRATAVGASLGAVAALRAALRRPDSFEGAVALSGPLSEHRLGPADASPVSPARLFLSASREEADIVLDDGLNLVEAVKRTGEELAGRGHEVRCAYGDGGHTYAAWESMLPHAISWVLREDRARDVR